MRSRWSDAEASEAVQRWAPRWGEDLALRVYTSRLLGREPSLVLHGGGNTSAKGKAREISGAETNVVWVKGSGWDLASIEPEGFPACRMEPLLACLALERLSDEDMVKALKSQMLDPTSPAPSVEALLHAFLPGRVVDHTHADAVLAVIDQPDGAERAREVWGNEVLLVPYVMPGFLLARRVAELGDRVRGKSVMVLEQHGIFTWGDSAKESYDRMLDAVTRAEDYVEAQRTRSSRPTTSVVIEAGGEGGRRAAQRRLSPLVRGALERAVDGGKFVLDWREEPEILSLAGRPDGRELSQIGCMTPDHVLRTKPMPAWVAHANADDAIAKQELDTELARYGAWYEGYFAANAPRYGGSLTRLDRLPRVILCPGLGALTLGKTLDDAKITGDVYAHTAKVVLDATALGRYTPASHTDLFDVEYWSLEQAKLKVKAAAGGALVRRIALVTGAAKGIGLTTATHFLELGAHVFLSDFDEGALAVATEKLAGRFGRRVGSIAADVTSATECRRIVDGVVDAFGGLDVVVSNAGNAPSGLLHTERGEDALRRSLELNLLSHQYVAHAACDVFLAQGTGGCLLFNASKSAFNPGKEFGPYAVPKAAVLALMRQYAVDLGGQGVRANAVNADRIRTALLDGLVESRARARGISPDEYFRDNLLGRETTALDVARAFAYLATAEATSGSVITVDGGNAAAFPR
ncbi:MAG TPA: bifunctional aldolase/short-chain dehydrogenase [Polyangiaceae bacterium]|jgi:rhamnose utilization protein RhaD (predicted bifunctional aldolase and dehydrogenase)/NAD(P)-dependent dehydrogenase (short-subunit alcohol dehydrogenase family)|nr:bifunctional aldolase/short-chain dehydrogenase [Polyangiaceae bacterium]